MIIIIFFYYYYYFTTHSSSTGAFLNVILHTHVWECWSRLYPDYSKIRCTWTRLNINVIYSVWNLYYDKNMIQHWTMIQKYIFRKINERIYDNNDYIIYIYYIYIYICTVVYIYIYIYIIYNCILYTKVFILLSFFIYLFRSRFFLYSHKR